MPQSARNITVEVWSSSKNPLGPAGDRLDQVPFGLLFALASDAECIKSEHLCPHLAALSIISTHFV